MALNPFLSSVPRHPQPTENHLLIHLQPTNQSIATFLILCAETFSFSTTYSGIFQSFNFIFLPSSHTLNKHPPPWVFFHVVYIASPDEPYLILHLLVPIELYCN